MKVYVTRKVEEFTKEVLKAFIEEKGYEFKSPNRSADPLLIAERPGVGRLASARHLRIKTMS